MAAQAVHWSGIPKVTRSWQTHCSKSYDLQPSPLCSVQYVDSPTADNEKIRAKGILPCVGWGVRPVHWIYRL